MPVPTGTSTPWREIEGPLNGGSSIVYYRAGDITGRADLLAEQLRIDGISDGLGEALRMADAVELEKAWYGEIEGEHLLCDEDGWTADGERVELGPFRCVTATVKEDE